MLAIGAFFASVLYTTNGCGGSSSPTSPQNSAAVQGVVSNAVTGAAVGNAAITMHQNANTFTAVSGNNGTYVVNGLLAGDLTVEADATGYSHFSNSARLAAGPNTLNIRLQPSP